MQKNDMDVGTGLVGAPACGDVMKLQIRVDEKTNTIADVKFKTFGCGSAIASSSYLTELVRGMTLEQAGKVRNTEIAKELCLPPVKCECHPQISLLILGGWLMIDDLSALLDAGRRCHQVSHLELLHQEPKGQGNRSGWNRSGYAED
jgi:NifU-like N terminal domain